MTNQEFTRLNILGHVCNYDNGRVARAFESCDPYSCDVRQYGMARSWSNRMRSPTLRHWWVFEAVRNEDSLDSPQGPR